MIIQGWIVLIVFVIQILFDIIMASVSKTFRNMAFENKILAGFYYFATLFAFVVILFYATICSIYGSEMRSCVVLSWLLTAVVVIMTVYTMIRTIMFVEKTKEKSVVRQEHK